ncbi:YciK family oxidoreductase [Neptunomonas phycophila]|jgi:NAD(P)-dependent dehydrogenase (short-subunit alcohol dehydrogenase family)|uniref:YciK family oxidoreductase n=1 Tax=Neptunomonas phycophila TaxID=1572645 RepID=A0AAW7XNK2_9GAMM|nr:MULTISPECIES: YciK family oxidoreductase [Neptunomonas]MDN2661105.1 YciK family oxidoreductase [Neptunomonas sp. CHC150]MDO6454380.1 YciK family oxidoreductase [Neptunomonas phycophila]MDO6782652.1 YciK family oxidoreductase [Neptunomonas phycophila]QLE96926.1 YciK family oxidoreductase [Neptunomonas phycophila]
MFDYQAPESLLADRYIVVTGAGDGIGKAAAIAYAKHGATVILLGRTTEKLEQVYDEIENAGGPQPAIVPLNLETATEHDYIEITNIIDQEFGRLDGILHNASLLGLRTPLESYDPVTWQQVMQVNVNAPFLLTQTLMPLLHRSEDASIIFTSSSVGRKGRAYWGAYSVSKFATEGMMQVMADEVSSTSNIRVNCINPGATRTAMRAYAYPAEDPTNNPTPDAIMPLYLYLMGADSKSVNGESMDAQA